jgi:SAM-dependent methyltransferase
VSTNDISNRNRQVWSTDHSADTYSRQEALFPAELQIFTMLAEELAAGRLLDIGVGAGRSTAYLHQRCREYVGIDYSPTMVDRAKSRFPQLELRVMDARDLSAFATDSFGVVVFSYNGIDYMGHEERLTTLKEIHRVLRPGSVFIFSTHNRNSKVLSAWSIRHLQTPPGLKALPKNLARFFLGIFNSLRVKKFERLEEDYALLNDMAERYRLLTYYIDPETQIAQLDRLGFGQVRVFSLEGTEVVLENVIRRPTDYMLHFVARALSLKD